MTDTNTLAPTDGLQKRCAEIIGWCRTGVLVGDTLRSHAESKWPGDIHNLQMAERATENEALCFIAKWGAPAPASHEALTTALAACRDAFPVPASGSAAEFEWQGAMTDPLGVPAYVRACAAPPAQEVRVPLSDVQIADALRARGLTLVKTAIGYDVLKLGDF